MYQYKIVTTEQLVDILQKNTIIGHQISRRHGILNATKSIFIDNGIIYLFDIDQHYIFDKEYGCTTNKFKEEYKDEKWIYEYAIG